MMTQTVESMTIDEILNTAIYNEKLAYDNYNGISEMLRKAKNVLAADFFLDQANREKGHFNSLMKLKEKVSPGSLLPVGEDIKWMTPDSGYDANVGISLSDALSIVEEKEHNADQFYRKAAIKTLDPEARKLFTQLAEEEAHQHYLIRKARTLFEEKGVLEPTDYEDLGFA